MYRCKVTGKLSKRGEKLNKIVLETRVKIYYTKIRNEDTGKWEDVEIGRGTEIVKEIDACEEGVKIWNEAQEAERAAAAAKAA